MNTRVPVNSAAGSGLVGWLRRAASPGRRRMLIVLLVCIPLWIYATTWDVAVMLFDNALDETGVGLSDIVQRVLVRLPLLPMLVATYLVAVNIPLRRRHWLRFGTNQFTIALVFSLLTRPALVVSLYLVNIAFGIETPFMQVYRDHMPWQYELASTVQYSIVYLLGLVLIFGIDSFLRLRAEQLRGAQLRAKWLEAKIGALRGQLNPHFFFNALNTIVSLIHTDPDRAETLLTELSTLLRRSMHDSNHEFTTVREEMIFIERYMTVMKARYEDRLDVAVDLDGVALDKTIPTFLLVPIVENAIKHGIAKVPARDTVEITGTYKGDQLTFTVKNACAPRGGKTDLRDGGMGLKNTRQRLFAIYGNQYNLDCGRDGDGHWVTSISLPIVKPPYSALETA